MNPDPSDCPHCHKPIETLENTTATAERRGELEWEMIIKGDCPECANPCALYSAAPVVKKDE